MYAKISGILLALGATFTLACADSTSPSERTDTTPAGPAAGLSGPVHQIAYHNGGSVMLINSDGSGPALLASPGWTPSWSPDGKRLVFSNTQCDTDWDSYLICEVGGLVILNPETHEIVTPSAGFVGEEPAWSPTGDMIAFVRRDTGHLYVMSLDESKPRDIRPAEVSLANNPSWSPDGRKIVFQCSGGPIGICVVHPDGTGFALLGTGRSGESRVAPDWSPDGTQIVLGILSAGTGKIAVMSADGSDQRVLTDGFGPAWSADGTQIAFSRNNDGLFIMNKDGSNIKRVVSGIANSPAWRP